jgi:hypothetical protein
MSPFRLGNVETNFNPTVWENTTVCAQSLPRLDRGFLPQRPFAF